MKRLLLLLCMVLLAMLIVPVMGTQLTFSKARDVANTTINITTGTPWSWWGYQGGLNGMFYNGQMGGSGFTLASPSQTTYAAATVIPDSSVVKVYIYTTSARTTNTEWEYPSPYCTGRAEMIVSGGIAYFYCNGQYRGNVSMPANPYYVAWGFRNLNQFASMLTDDYVYGTNEVREVIDMPDGELYGIQKDFITSASSGMIWLGNKTTANSTYLPISFSRGNASAGMVNGEPLTNKSLCLKHILTDTCYQYKYTGDKVFGQVNFDIATFTASDAPFGFYTVELEGSEAQADTIVYVGSGATVAFDRDAYSQQDIATLTYSVTDYPYWDISTYEYRIDIIDATTWRVVDSSPLSVQTGTVTYQFSDSDSPGTYYAALVAKYRSTGADAWMAIDWADLDAYVTFYGYVMNQTGSVLSGANVSVVQGNIYDSAVTIADGNYTVTGFYAGISTRLNVTASGYSQWNVTLTPPTAKRVYLNFTLNSTSPDVIGKGIGGVARDGVFNATTRMITNGYGRPISGATIFVLKTETGESYNRTTNVAGWYLCDEGASCILASNFNAITCAESGNGCENNPYNVYGQKAGYNNSPNYSVVVS